MLELIEQVKPGQSLAKGKIVIEHRVSSLEHRVSKLLLNQVSVRVCQLQTVQLPTVQLPTT